MPAPPDAGACDPCLRRTDPGGEAWLVVVAQHPVRPGSLRQRRLVCVDERTDGLGLRDNVERATLVELHIDDHERLQTRTELGCGAPNPFCNGTNLAVLLA